MDSGWTWRDPPNVLSTPKKVSLIMNYDESNHNIRKEDYLTIHNDGF